MKISVLILTLNEEANLRALLPTIHHCLIANDLANNYEIVIIDGGSKDQTVQVAKQNGATVFTQSSPGYGSAFREGVSASNGDYILAIDADFSHPPELIRTMLSESKNYDIVIASRFIKDSIFISNPSRILLSRILSFVVRIIFHVPVKDVSSGYRLYKRSSINKIPLNGQNFDVLVEILIRAYQRGLTICEIPFKYSSRRHGYSHVRFIKFAISYTQTFFRLFFSKTS